MRDTYPYPITDIPTMHDIFTFADREEHRSASARSERCDCHVTLVLCPDNTYPPFPYVIVEYLCSGCTGAWRVLGYRDEQAARDAYQRIAFAY